MYKSLIQRFFGTENDRRIKSVQPLIQKINALEDDLKALSDDALKEKTAEFRKRVSDGEALDDLLAEAFAVVREAGVRVLGMRIFDVQLIGGIFLHRGFISEMKTGEGKTLMSTLPAYLNALTGRPVHLVTVNDYLAERDAEWMGPLYAALDMTTGVNHPDANDRSKAEAYACDILYSTNNELGFDYLRDNMKSSLDAMHQKDHHFAIIDEVDSVLIDEARTPLIISGPSENRKELYVKVNALIPKLSETMYSADEKDRNVTLTDEGVEFAETALIDLGILPEGQSLYAPESTSIVHHVNQALVAHILFKADKDYIVRNNQVMLIDEFTGRMMDGRRLSNGLHQALEAKENVAIQPENVTLASVTYQNYFRLYSKLGGMTGTAQTEAEEFRTIYGLGVVEVPTNMPVIRRDVDDAIYRSAVEKYEAIVQEIANAYSRKQPILVGTTSIEKSEYLSALLKDTGVLSRIVSTLETRAETIKFPKQKATVLETAERLKGLAKSGGIPHQVLNARFHEQEANIIAEAGVPGAVTIATNMAGRGTDIKLGGNPDIRLSRAIEEDPSQDEGKLRKDIEEEVARGREIALEAGGLYVLATERHESRRIDNQLRGRSGRQGDPGRSAFYISLEDDLMRIFGSDRLEKVLSSLGMKEGEAIIHPWINKSLEKAQAKVEGRNFDIRKELLKYDDVRNDQRKAVFEQRRDVMETDDASEIISDMREQIIDDLVDAHMPPKSYADQWDGEAMEKDAFEALGFACPIKDWQGEEGVDQEVIRERLIEASNTFAAQKEEEMGSPLMRDVEKQILLSTIDKRWREQIVALDYLRSVVGFRGYAQRDPLNEYKTESFSLFEQMIEGLRKEVVIQIARTRKLTAEEIAIAELEASKKPREGFDETDPSTWGNPSRNDPCPCGSGKKFKHCHGKV